jgi:hypothetical protein
MWGKPAHQASAEKESSSYSSSSSSESSPSSSSYTGSSDSEEYFKPQARATEERKVTQTPSHFDLPRPLTAEASSTPIKLHPEPESFEAVNCDMNDLQTMLRKNLESLQNSGMHSDSDSESDGLEIIYKP